MLLYQASERETTVTMTDADEYVIIDSWQPKHVRALRKAQGVVVLIDNPDPEVPHIRVSLPAANWSPVGGVKRKRTMTLEQRQVAAERLVKARAAKSGEPDEP